MQIRPCKATRQVIAVLKWFLKVREFQWRTDSSEHGHHSEILLSASDVSDLIELHLRLIPRASDESEHQQLLLREIDRIVLSLDGPTDLLLNQPELKERYLLLANDAVAQLFLNRFVCCPIAL